MRQELRFAFLTVAAAVFLALVFATLGQSKGKPGQVAAARALLPLKLNEKLPLSVTSHPVEWRSNVYHLVALGSIRFELDPQSGHLQAEIRGGVTTFDNADYTVSTAVLDAHGKLLGAARGDCKVERIWLGDVLTTEHTLTLDFGKSLDYVHATDFMISINRVKVLTPDEWQSTK